MNQSIVSALKKSLLTNTKIKLKQEKFVPPHPAVISREKQKNKKHRRRPNHYPKRDEQDNDGVFFTYSTRYKILKPSGQESFSILIYKRKKKELKKYKNFYNLKKKTRFWSFTIFFYV